jgi:hypothetical protein
MAKDRFRSLRGPEERFDRVKVRICEIIDLCIKNVIMQVLWFSA